MHRSPVLVPQRDIHVLLSECLDRIVGKRRTDRSKRPRIFLRWKESSSKLLLALPRYC
uniref:Uncharacterized protein n=1 Tax=Parascaris univalens TaxID=6257 RepID=A0A915BPA5_PARUN